MTAHGERAGQLVGTPYTGVDNGESTEQDKQTEVTRIPCSGSSLAVKAYEPPKR